MQIKLKEHMNMDCTFTEIKERQMEISKMNGDMPGTLWDMYEDLKQAGFKSVDCMLKIQNLAVMVAEK
ncbi:MAG: Methyltransferase type 12 [Firmicutes bacterium]|nr:Methyltransferase type 12 [Bacillota bacterium]